MAATAAAVPMRTWAGRPLRRRPPGAARRQAARRGEHQQHDGRDVDLRVTREWYRRDQAADDDQALGARVRRRPRRTARHVIRIATIVSQRDGERPDQPGLRQDLKDAGVARGQDGKVVIRDRCRRPDARPRTRTDPDER